MGYIITFIFAASTAILCTRWYFKKSIDRANSIFDIYSDVQTAEKQLEETYQKIDQVKENITTTQKFLDTFEARERKAIDENLALCKQNQEHELNNKLVQLEKQYNEACSTHKIKLEQLANEQTSIENNLNKIKATLSASIEAQLREQEKEDKKDFYSLSLNQKDIYEINVIKSIEPQLSDPRPVRMLIWSSYYLKKANELSSRVLGKDKVTGIYKITNIITNQSYIGQQKDVKERWREHMKCGLGIDAPPGNKLYAAMQKTNLESFTFELLEACDAADLNNKERFYIDLYSTYDFGYNSNKGIK